MEDIDVHLREGRNMTVIWSKESRSIFERFAMELRDFMGNQALLDKGSLPFYGDQDINYCLELQKKRLESKNLRMEYDFVPNGHFPDASFDATKIKNCPNCGTQYQVGDDDWVVLEVKKR